MLLLTLPQASHIDAVIGEDMQILSTKEMSCLLFYIFFLTEQNGKLFPFPLLNMIVARRIEKDLLFPSTALQYRLNFILKHVAFYYGFRYWAYKPFFCPLWDGQIHQGIQSNLIVLLSNLEKKMARVWHTCLKPLSRKPCHVLSDYLRDS